MDDLINELNGLLPKNLADAAHQQNQASIRVAVPTASTLQEKRGTHFDPAVLDAFSRRRSEVIRIATEFAD